MVTYDEPFRILVALDVFELSYYRSNWIYPLLKLSAICLELPRFVRKFPILASYFTDPSSDLIFYFDNVGVEPYRL